MFVFLAIYPVRDRAEFYLQIFSPSTVCTVVPDGL